MSICLLSNYSDIVILHCKRKVPPMMVLMREAWPGQSTRVNCTD